MRCFATTYEKYESSYKSMYRREYTTESWQWVNGTRLVMGLCHRVTRGIGCQAKKWKSLLALTFYWKARNLT